MLALTLRQVHKQIPFDIDLSIVPFGTNDPCGIPRKEDEHLATSWRP
jgi:hypothetical protein